jgi:hypothetical protein
MPNNKETSKGFNYELSDYFPLFFELNVENIPPDSSRTISK